MYVGTGNNNKNDFEKFSKAPSDGSSLRQFN